MNVKNIVKVMNFHSLIRVDNARKEAEKYFLAEEELREMIQSISNNRNFVLDKRMLNNDVSKPVLNVYIGSDLGFCGSYNYTVNEHAKKDPDADKIVIGKKLYKGLKNVKISVNKAEYMEKPKIVTDYITEAVKKQTYSEINILYNNYENMSTIGWLDKRIYPFEFNNEDEYTEDFISESNLEDLLVDMVSTYIDFEVKITVINSIASENIMRQNSTTESLKKIDEIDEEHMKRDRKKRVEKTSQKMVESYVQRKSMERAGR